MAVPNSNPLNGLFGHSSRPRRVPLRYCLIVAAALFSLLAFSSIHFGVLDPAHPFSLPAAHSEAPTSDVSSDPVVPQPVEAVAAQPGWKQSGSTTEGDAESDAGFDEDASEGGKKEDTPATSDEPTDISPENSKQPPKDNHHGPWKPVQLKSKVHEVKVGHGQKAEIIYPLKPFPPAPMEHEISPREDTPWLAAVICSPGELASRNLIRATWMRLYRSPDLPFDGRFVVSNPGPWWTEIIRKENQTFGDLIVLDELQEDDFTANTVKTQGFYHWLLNKSPKKYQFVSKLDADLWLNARRFWDHFLEPRLTNDTGIYTSTVNRTVIGQLNYNHMDDVVYPQGGMYTLSWDAVELLAGLQVEHQVVAAEDLCNAQLLLEGKETLTVVNMKGSEKFNYDDPDTRPGMAWAWSTTQVNATNHALYGDEPTAVHLLKTDDHWNKVARCFDSKGIKQMPREVQKPEPQNVKYEKSYFGRIPTGHWEFKDGIWVCNGIWKLEPGVWPNPDFPDDP